MHVLAPSALGFIHVDEPLISVSCPEVLFCPAKLAGQKLDVRVQVCACVVEAGG